MRRLVLMLALVGALFIAGCADGGTGGELIEETSDPSADGTNDTEPETEDTTAVKGELEIHHIDVGQADATLIRTPTDETILIDTGDWRQSGSGVMEYLDDQGIDRIDHLIGTHGHADHIGGHAAIIETFETERDGIGAIYDSGVPHTSQTYENYLDAVAEHGHELLVVEAGDELPIDDPAVSGTVLNPPTGDSGSNLHDNSVAVIFEFGDVRYLTTGDAESRAEARMVKAWANELDADVYQAGHHGSSTSSTPEFLETVSPDIAVISSDIDSQYGHPHDEVLESFADRNIETYWTGVHGDIVLTTDGSEIDVGITNVFSNDPEELLEAKHQETPEGSVIIPSTPPRAAG